MEVAIYMAESDEDILCDSVAYTVNQKECAEYLEVYADVDGTEGDRANVASLRRWIVKNRCNVKV